MKKCILLIIAVTLIFAYGCYSTVIEYDTAGNKIKEYKTNVADKLLESTKDKTIITWKSGWAGYVSVSMATTDDPTPTGKIFAGKFDDGYMSIKQGDAEKIDWNGVAKVVSATSKTLAVTTSGISETRDMSTISDSDKALPKIK